MRQNSYLLFGTAHKKLAHDSPHLTYINFNEVVQLHFIFLLNSSFTLLLQDQLDFEVSWCMQQLTIGLHNQNKKISHKQGNNLIYFTVTV